MKHTINQTIMKTLTKSFRNLVLVICSLYWLSMTQAQTPLYTVTFNISVPFATISFAGITNPMGNYVFPLVPEGSHYFSIDIPGLYPVSGQVNIFHSQIITIILPYPYDYNVIKVLNAVGSSGQEIDVGFYIYNYDVFVGFQADIISPEGFVWVFGQLTLNPARILDHLIQGNIIPGTNILRIISFSPTNAAYLGNQGIIATFSISTPSLAGTFPLDIENAVMTNGEGANIINWAFPGIVTLEQVNLPGDANCDGFVNVQDVVVIISYILGNKPQPFCFQNADVNGDGIINVADVVGTVNIILN